MSGIIAFIVGLWHTVSAVVGGFLSGVLVKVGAILAGLGLKLLSFEWIKKVWEIIQKIWGVLKKTIFNAKFLAVVKVILAVGICGLVGFNCFSVGKQVYLEHQTLLELFNFENTLQSAQAVGVLMVAIGLIISAVSVLLFVFGLIKKRVRLGFIPAILLTYIVALFVDELIYFPFMQSLIQQFKLINLIALLTVFYAVIKAFDKDRHSSFFGFFFCGLGLLLAFLLFKSSNLAQLMTFSTSEAQIGLSDLNLINLIRGMGGKETIVGIDSVMVEWCLGYATRNGNFVCALVYMGLVLCVFVAKLFPYLILSLAVGFLMGVINDRPNQHVFLSRVLEVLKLAVIFVLVVTVVVIVLAVAFKDPAGLSIGVGVGSLIFTLAMCALLAIIAGSARALFQNKPYNKLGFKSDSKGGKA